MLERDQDVQLNVVGVVGDQGVLLDKEGLDTKRALEYMLGKKSAGMDKPTDGGDITGKMFPARVLERFTESDTRRLLWSPRCTTKLHLRAMLGAWH